MSKRIKRKSLAMICVQLVCTIALGAFLLLIQNSLSVSAQQKATLEKLAQIDELAAAADVSAGQVQTTFDGIYQAKARSLAYMVQQEIDPELEPGVMEQYRSLLNVDNVLVIRRDGRILSQSGASPADFRRSRYNQLKTVFDDREPSAPFQVEIDGVARRYYAAWIDDGRMAVVEQRPEEMTQLLEDTSSWRSILENVSVGLHGYAFAVSAQDYTFLYHPDATLIGQDALDAGIDVEALEEGRTGWIDVYGQRLYAGVTQLGNTYVVCAVSEDELNSDNLVTVVIVLFVFIAVVTIVIAYAMLMLSEAEKGEAGRDDYAKLGRLRFHKKTATKILTTSIIGLACILGISFYMQTLFNLSQASMSNAQHMSEVQSSAARYARDVQILTERYNRAYLSKAETAAYVLDKRPELRNRQDLAGLSEALDVEYSFVFDVNGVMVATDSPYSHFTLSQNPEDQSYAFNSLLQGVPYLIQEARPDDVEHVYRQYVGVTLRDDAGDADGFVQIAVYPALLEDAVSNMDMRAILQNIKVGTNGFAFSTDRGDEKNFLYYPDERYIGRSALEHGMTEDQFIDGDSGYIKLGLDKYFATAMETTDEFVFLAVPKAELGGNRVYISLLTTAFSLVCLGLICFMLSVEREPSRRPARKRKKVKRSLDRERMVDVVVDGEVKKTESAFSRWSNVSMNWGERTPEQKVFAILRALVVALAALICAAVIFKDRLFDSTSVFRYVIEGTWKRTFNIFSVTACVLILMVVIAATTVLRGLLKLLSRSLDARGDTVCRLLSNLVKYVSVIAAAYYCFAQFGVDTATLLASAGILSLVIGLGSKDLITDILAGLFIIFEGDFRVGDIVTIGDWRGTVIEIGVRTTKIEEPSKNIKIFNNSAISGVINMTRKESVALCEVSIEYGESLERVEAILAEELPKIKDRLPAILDGPSYGGVVALADSGVIIRVLAQCAEGDRPKLARDLNREIKLIFDRHNINIPFPQVVLNQPVDFKEATEWQRRRAEEYAREQSEITKDMDTQV